MSRHWLTSPGFKLSAEERRKAIRLLGLAGFLLVLVVGLWLITRAGHFRAMPPSDDPRDLESGFQAMGELFRVAVGVAKAPLVVGLACAEFIALDRSELGRRLWHWCLGEPRGLSDTEVVSEIMRRYKVGLIGIKTEQLVSVTRELIKPMAEDPENVPAIKSLVAGLVFVALLVVNALLLGGH